MPQQPVYRRQGLDHGGLVAGLVDELGISEGIDQATAHTPERRMVTTGQAVKARGRTGLGVVNPPRDLGPPFFQHTPTARLSAPAVAARPLHDDTRGRALETRYAYGVTARYRLMAATAATRWGLAPPVVHLDRTRFHVDGRHHSDEDPSAPVMQLTRGDSRDHRPDLNPGMLDLMVEPQAGIPVLMNPLRGHSRDATDCGQIVSTPGAPLQTTDGPTDLGADRARSRADNLQTLAHTRLQWMTRVPATVHDAQAALAQAAPQTMTPLMAGDRAHEWVSTSGDVAQRWSLLHSEPRPPQAQRAVDQQRRPHRDQEVTAFTQRCDTALACDAEAPHARATVAPGGQATFLDKSTVRPTARDSQRGRPRQGARPDHVVSSLQGALASRLAAQQALVDQHRCVILATNERDDQQWPARERLDGSKGQSHAEHGCRFLTDPSFVASSLSLKKPERIRAVLLVMTVCWLVYAALEYRVRHARQDHGATVPDQPGRRTPPPPTRWIFHDFVGIHGLVIPQPWPRVINLTDEPQHLLPLLGDRDAWWYR